MIKVYMEILYDDKVEEEIASPNNFNAKMVSDKLKF